jgi:hypothetical protein
MIKYFCDMCESEITNKNRAKGGESVTDRLGTTLRRKGNSLHVEVMTGDGEGNANGGLFCKYCILDALQALDDRPREAPHAVGKESHAGGGSKCRT